MLRLFGFVIRLVFALQIGVIALVALLVMLGRELFVALNPARPAHPRLRAASPAAPPARPPESSGKTFTASVIPAVAVSRRPLRRLPSWRR